MNPPFYAVITITTTITIIITSITITVVMTITFGPPNDSERRYGEIEGAAGTNVWLRTQGLPWQPMITWPDLWLPW